MPGSNAGTGHPLTFRCAKCKAGGRTHDIHGRWVGLRDIGTHWEVTGRIKDNGAHGARMSGKKVEYVCLDCGHSGWSSHHAVYSRWRYSACYSCGHPRKDHGLEGCHQERLDAHHSCGCRGFEESYDQNQ